MRKRTQLSILAVVLLLSALAIAIIYQPQLFNIKNQPGNAQHNLTVTPANPSDTNRSSANLQIPQSCGLLKVFVINMSQADAILIITPGNKTILIDSGSGMKKNSSSNAVAFLKRMGVRNIDYLVASHYHEDHIGGMNDIFRNFDVGTVYDNGNCGNYSSGVQVSFQGYSLSHAFIHVPGDMDLPADGCLSDVRLIVAYDRPEGCWPSNKDTSNENDNSILLRLAYGNTSFLFTGDCEAGCEAELLKQGTYLRSDFLKVGHHGSATSSTSPFLDAVNAEYFAISTDRVKSVSDGYYHPRKQSLSNIFSRIPDGLASTSTFRTDLNGDISAISDGSSIIISAQSNASLCQLFSGYSSSNVSSYGPIPGLTGACK